MPEELIRKINKDAYPFLLKQINSLPQSMDIVGTLPDDDHKFLCVIGSRKYSKYGEEVCRKIISGLYGYPIVIVSGLAIGIDSIAHESAISAGLKTLAFPGSGLSPKVLYPRSKRILAKNIIENGGALISPFPYLQNSTQYTFPIRNRLMAGISHATLIIEAEHNSGTLLTSRYATDFNRDIFVVPGSIFSSHTYGPHMLMKSGAMVVTCADDILIAFGLKQQYSNNQLTLLPDFDSFDLTEDERNIISKLKVQNLNSTELMNMTGISTESLSISLSSLELKGLIKDYGDSYGM